MMLTFECENKLEGMVCAETKLLNSECEKNINSIDKRIIIKKLSNLKKYFLIIL